MSTNDTPRTSYVLGAREERVFVGLGAVEVVALCAFLALSLAVLMSQKSAVGGGAALVIAGVGVAAAWLPIAGRSGVQWLLIGVRWAAVRTGGVQRWSRRPETFLRKGRLSQLVDLPGELGRLELWEAHDRRGTPVGVIRDRKANTYVATLLVRGTTNWTLEGEDEQARIVADYGSMLARLARDRAATSRVAWVERTLPEAPDALVRDLYEHRAADVSFDDARTRSYLELLEGAGRQADHHELLVTVLVRGAAARRQAKRRKWSNRDAPHLVLMEELALVASQLELAHMEVRTALSPSGYLAALRTGLDPWGRLAFEQSFQADDAVDESQVAPTAREEHWNRVIVDGSQHATLWVEAWPGMRVGPGFLDPLLVDSDGAVRTAAVVMELRGPRTGARKAEHDVTEAEAAEATRRSIGKRTSSRVRKRDQSRYDHEDELADGHADVRFVGYIIVSAPGSDPSVLETEVDRVTMQASGCNLRIERLYGAQASALTFGLPLARGLR